MKTLEAGMQTRALRATLEAHGVPYTRGYRILDRRGAVARVVNDDNVTTYCDTLGRTVTAEEDDETGLLSVDLTADQLTHATVARSQEGTLRCAEEAEPSALEVQTARCVASLASCVAYLAVPARKGSRGRAVVADALRRQADALSKAVPAPEEHGEGPTAPLSTLRAVERKLDGLCAELSSGAAAPLSGAADKGLVLAMCEGALAALTHARVLLGAYGGTRQRDALAMPARRAAQALMERAYGSYGADAPVALGGR